MASCVTDSNNLVLGRGRLRFDRHINGIPQGERYLGDTSELNATQDVTTLDFFSSDFGVKEMTDQMALQNTRSGSFITNNISMDNVAAFFGGTVQNEIRSQQTDVKEFLNGGNPVNRGMFYQLGVSEDYPHGLGGVQASSFQIMYAAAGVSISIGDGDISTISGLTTLPTANYELDPTTGEIYIEPDAPDLAAPAQIVVQYNRLAQSQVFTISSDDQVRGSLRFISDNPKGTQKNYYWPLVTLTPNGDYALKGDDWQALSFNFGVLRKDCNTPNQVVYQPAETVSGALTMSVVASPTSIAADNIAISTVTATVVDGTGNPAANQDVTFAISGVVGATISSASAITNASGVASVEVKGPGAGTATIQATLVSTGQTQNVSVTLTA